MVVRSLLVVPFGLMTHSLSLFLSQTLVRFFGMDLSLELTHSHAMVLFLLVVRSGDLVHFALMTHSLSVDLSQTVVRSGRLVLSLFLTRSAELVLLANLAHFLPLVLLRWMVRS